MYVRAFLIPLNKDNTMENDLNNDQAVTDQNTDLNTADVVNQQNLADDQAVQDQNQDNVLADGTDTNKSIPYAEFQKANEKAKESETARQDAENRLAMMQNMQNQQTQQTQQTIAAPKTASEQALQDLGFEEEDLYGGNIVKYHQRLNEINNQAVQQNNAALANQQFMATHPDVSQVVGTVNPMTGQPVYSAELLAVLQEKPHLAGACNSVQGAYNVVMEARELSKLRQTGQIADEHLTRKGVDTQIAPLGGSAAGGGGAGSQQGQGMLSREQSQQIEQDIAAGKYS